MSIAGSAVADGQSVSFLVADQDRQFASVRLNPGLGTTGPRPSLQWREGVWSVRLMLPAVHRLEYTFDATPAAEPGAGPAAVVHTPVQVLELPEYTRPTWLSGPPPAGATTPLAQIGGVTAALWTPDRLGDDQAAPLLVVHDGPEYVGAGALTHYLGVMHAQGDLPPCRVLVTSAQPRDELYAASPTHAAILVDDLLATATRRWPAGPVIAVGASLGALAALHVEWTRPGTFAGLFLQSGSFFTPQTDPQEAGFPGWEAAMGFVRQVLSDPRAAHLPVTAMTCGRFEENAANNALLAARLRSMGVAVTYTETADLHNVTSWRDSYHPMLRDLLRAAAP